MPYHATKFGEDIALSENSKMVSRHRIERWGEER